MKKESVSVWLYDKKRNKKDRISITLPSTKRDQLQTRRATFASFIHQMDAAIASWVISTCAMEGTQIYTVHDCFITDSLAASRRPYIYTNTLLYIMSYLFAFFRDLRWNGPDMPYVCFPIDRNFLCSLSCSIWHVLSQQLCKLLFKYHPYLNWKLLRRQYNTWSTFVMQKWSEMPSLFVSVWCPGFFQIS